MFGLTSMLGFCRWQVTAERLQKDGGVCGFRLSSLPVRHYLRILYFGAPCLPVKQGGEDVHQCHPDSGMAPVAPSRVRWSVTPLCLGMTDKMHPPKHGYSGLPSANRNVRYTFSK
jgi:hypothetical protein